MYVLGANIGLFLGIRLIILVLYTICYYYLKVHYIYICFIQSKYDYIESGSPNCN